MWARRGTCSRVRLAWYDRDVASGRKLNLSARAGEKARDRFNLFVPSSLQGITTLQVQLTKLKPLGEKRGNS